MRAYLTFLNTQMGALLRGDLKDQALKEGFTTRSTRWCKQGSTRYYLTRRGIKIAR